jgi:thiol-disulfide isomerase/thioredoxin
MKSKLMFIGLLAILFMFACKSGKVKEQNTGIVEIDGTFLLEEGALVESMGNTSDFIVLSGGKYRERHEIDISNGKFNIKIKLDSPGIWNLNYMNAFAKTIFLAPNYKVNVVLDSDIISDGIKVTGSGATENEILESMEFYLEQVELPDSENIELGLKNIEAINSEAQSYLNQLLSDKKVDEVFTLLMQEMVFYWNLNNKVYFGYENDIETKEYYMFVNDVALENANLLSLNVYRRFLQNYIDIQAGPLSGKSIYDYSLSQYIDESFKIINRFNTEDIKSYLALRLSKLALEQGGLEEYNKIKDSNISLITDSIHIKSISSDIEKLMKIAKGNEAPNFSGVDLDGKEVSLNDFKGKYVYIDVWATWCVPCKKEIPYFKTLINDYKDKNIAFLSFSIDDNIEEWEDFCKSSEDIGSVHLYGGSQSTLIDDYQLSGIPLFILIDDSGNIIDANAPRPSSDNIREVFDSLFN